MTRKNQAIEATLDDACLARLLPDQEAGPDAAARLQSLKKRTLRSVLNTWVMESLAFGGAMLLFLHGFVLIGSLRQALVASLLLIGLKSDRFYLLNEFDTTPAERWVAAEMSS